MKSWIEFKEITALMKHMKIDAIKHRPILGDIVWNK